jgi:hypothetical protein
VIISSLSNNLYNLIEDHRKQLKNSREALADEVEGCDVVKVKTEPDNFEKEELNNDMNDNIY